MSTVAAASPGGSQSVPASVTSPFWALTSREIGSVCKGGSMPARSQHARTFAAPALGEDQVHVAELVPEVAPLEGGPVGAFEELAAGRGLE